MPQIGTLNTEGSIHTSGDFDTMIKDILSDHKNQSVLFGTKEWIYNTKIELGLSKPSFFWNCIFSLKAPHLIGFVWNLIISFQIKSPPICNREKRRGNFFHLNSAPRILFLYGSIHISTKSQNQRLPHCLPKEITSAHWYSICFPSKLCGISSP